MLLFRKRGGRRAELSSKDAHACHCVGTAAGSTAHDYELGDACGALHGCLSQAVSVCLLSDSPLDLDGRCWNTCVEIIVVERRHDEGVVGRTPTLGDSDKHHDVTRFSCRRVYLEDVRGQILSGTAL
jgi:hypothetical protein